MFPQSLNPIKYGSSGHYWRKRAGKCGEKEIETLGLRRASIQVHSLNAVLRAGDIGWQPYLRQRRLKALAVGALIGFLGIGLASSRWGEALETAVGLPVLYLLRGPVAAPPAVVVVAIDERAAEALLASDDTADALNGSEDPADWRRTIHARLIEGLVRSEAAVIAFDMYFETPKEPEDDLAFADAIANAGRVVLFERIEADVVRLTGPDGNPIRSNREELIPPLPILAAAAEGLGPSALPAGEGDYNRYWAFKASVGNLPTLPAVALHVYTRPSIGRWLELLERHGLAGVAAMPRLPSAERPADRLQTLARAIRSEFIANPALSDVILEAIAQEPGLSATERRDMTALTELYAGDEARWLKFYGPPGTIRTIPFDRLLLPEQPDTDWEPIDLTGAAVFVGYSDIDETESPDTFATFYTTSDAVKLSGVEIVATAFGNLLTGGSLRQLPVITAFTMLLGLGLVFGTVAYLAWGKAGVLLTLGAGVAYVLAARYAFAAHDVWMPVATPLLAQAPLAIALGLLGQIKFERRRIDIVMENLGDFIPRDVLEQLPNREFDSSTLNRTFDATCLATDMSGSVTIAARMSTKDFAALMSEYFKALGARLEKHRVRFTEFRGDAILCAWDGSRNPIEARSRAVLAGLDVVDSIREFSEAHAGLSLTARVGIDCGDIKLEIPRTGQRRAYTIIGNCANVASRLEGLAKKVGANLVLSQEVVTNLDDLLTRTLGQFQLEGLPRMLEVTEVLSHARDASDTLVDRHRLFAAAFAAFYRCDWDEAERLFAALVEKFPEDRTARYFLAKTREFLSDPPPNGGAPPVILVGK